MASTLPGPAAQASKAALQAALAENEKNGATVPEGEEEGQELEFNMEKQADNIRTVFSDPTNFNVKVRRGDHELLLYPLELTDASIGCISFSFLVRICSIHSIRPGLSGLTHQQRRAETCLRPLHFPPSPPHHCQGRPGQPPPWAGWRISNESSASTASRSSGGKLRRRSRHDDQALIRHFFSQFIQQHRSPIAIAAESELLPLQGAGIKLLPRQPLKLTPLRRTYRRESSQHGKMKPTRVVANGVYSCPKTRIGPRSTRCGFTP
jgi:hypothetical protein